MKNITDIDNEIRTVCAAIREDIENAASSVPRLAKALEIGAGAIEADPGFIAYAKLGEIPVAKNDYDGRASVLRKAKLGWEHAVLFPAYAEYRVFLAKTF